MQFIKITIKYFIKAIYRRSWSTIKYPRLNIIGDIIIIIELEKNSICWKKIFLWLITNNVDIAKPAILTKMPVKIEIIKEFNNAFSKFI